MIIRRNIRINVLLTIYEQIQQNDTINRSAAQNSLNDKFSQIHDLDCGNILHEFLLVHI
jgi:hypothetical protein